MSDILDVLAFFVTGEQIASQSVFFSPQWEASPFRRKEDL